MISRTAAFAIVALLGGAVSGPAGAVAVPASPQSEAVGVRVSVVPAEGTQPTADDAADVPDGSLAEIEVVVPAVTAGEIKESPEVLAGRADESVVVADEVVADRVTSEVVETDDFQTLGVTWPEGSDGADLAAQVRVRADGEWSGWLDFEQGDEAPDAGTADAANAVRGGTDPLWVGDADAVQLSFAASVDGGPDDMALVLIGSDEVPLAPDDAIVGSAASGEAVFEQVSFSDGLVTASGLVAASSAPTVISRAEWGARAPVCTPDVATQLVGAVVHHTAGSNDYATVAQAMQQVRNDQSYHIDGRGWCDIGYNFIVDKWGNIYEGRANSSTQPVIGVHAGGFNTGTVGISMLGSYGTVNPPAATQESVARIAAWRLGQYHRDPGGTFVYHTLGGENSKFPAGADVGLPVLFSHRDVGNTACPGNAGYATLPGIRDRARQLIGTSFINPSATPGSIDPGSLVTVRAATLNNINWRLDVTHAVSGAQVAASIGYAQQAFGGVVATWDGRDTSGRAVGVGIYRLTLTGSDATSGAAVVPFSATVQVARDPDPPVVDPVPLVGDLEFVPLTPQRLLDTRESGVPVGPRSRMDLVVTGVGGVPADAKAVALNVTTVGTSGVDFLRVYPAGQPAPGTSILNTDQARTTNAGTIVGVGGEGKVSVYNNAGTTHVIVDVTGYFTDQSGVGDRYSPLAAGARVLDTRQEGGRLTSAQVRTVTVGGRLGIPADATAVLANVSSVMASGPGNINAFPSGGTVPVAASVNHLPGDNISNRTVIPLSSDGKVDLALQGGSADVVIDVVGWFGPGADLGFTPVVPVRAFDTRLTGERVIGGQTRAYSLSAAHVPTSAKVAMLSVATTQPSATRTFITVWALGATRPTASDLNTGRGRDQANLTAVPVGSDARVQVYNDAGYTELVVDVLGYFD